MTEKTIQIFTWVIFLPALLSLFIGAVFLTQHSITQKRIQASKDYVWYVNDPDAFTGKEGRIGQSYEVYSKPYTYRNGCTRFYSELLDAEVTVCGNYSIYKMEIR